VLHSGKERDGERGVLYFTLVRRKTGQEGCFASLLERRETERGVLNLAPGEKRDEGRCAALHF
jgi:hypothetical protein